MAGIDGSKINELPQLSLPVRTGDLNEVIKPEVKDYERYGNFKVQVAGAATPVATTERPGKVALAPHGEALGWEGDNAVTPDDVLLVVKDMLQYAITGTSGISVSYDSGAGTITISAASGGLHIGTNTTDYGMNTLGADFVWGSSFGSIDPPTVPSGPDADFTVAGLSTYEGDKLYFIVAAVLPQNFMSTLSVAGINGGAPFDTTATDGYFVTDIGGTFCTAWRWTIPDIGDFASMGDRAVSLNYNSIYQTHGTTKTYLFNPNSLYAWFSWPDPDTGDGDQYQGEFAQGGKMDVFAAFASSLYPSTGSFGDPAVFGKHCGISIGKLTSDSSTNWVLLFLQNSDGTENYRITSPCWAGNLDTVNAVYHVVENDVNWGTKAYGWQVNTLGWGGAGFDNFTIENLD